MDKISNKKITMLTSTLICIALLLTPICSAGLIVKDNIKNDNFQKISKLNQYKQTAEPEYWALIFAVGVYKNNPNQDRPSMLDAADNLYDVLTDSPDWQADHIHKVTDVQATGKNLIKELFWLIKSSDNDDLVLVYLTTHGGHLVNFNGLPLDLPPRDEADGSDELLVMYEGFENWYAIIWDDLLNFLLGRIKSQGVCLIVDSCYSGGFNDPPFGNIGSEIFNAESFGREFGEELANKNRIVLMSSQENEVSYGSYFSELLIDGLGGLGDLFGNGNGENSAEECFAYAKFWLDLLGEQHPTIYDGFTGEFPIT